MSVKFCLPLVLVISMAANAQFKNDNVLYKTVDPADICSTLEKNKGYILLDVRSPGEYADTSRSASLNLGHLKGARNINISELGKRLAEIKDYKDQPVFVYCSHSQRSRRAGKMLADSGFTHVFNINGGMTAIHYTGAAANGCLKDFVQTGNSYSIISFNELCAKMGKEKGPVLIDVRSDSAFRHISRDAKENAIGTLKGSFNIPLSQIEQGMAKIPRDREVVLIDIYGDDASKAAVILNTNGYRYVSVLIEGIDRLLYTDKKNSACRDKLYGSPIAYQTITVSEFGELSKVDKDYILLDVRTADEFANKHKDSWRNIGHINGAVNIPVADLPGRYNELDRNKEIMIYALGGGKEPFDAANILQQKGFSNIKVIYGGVFNMRWTAGNVKGQSYLADMVVDIPASNQ